MTSLSPVPWESNCSCDLPPAQMMLGSTKYMVVGQVGRHVEPGVQLVVSSGGLDCRNLWDRTW